MENFFLTIYGWFNSFYCDNLLKYLDGYNCSSEAYDSALLFQSIGITTFVISLFTVVIYYYVINHPRFNTWLSWLITLVVNGIICLLYAALKIQSDLDEGLVEQCLLPIDSNDYWGFGISNFIISSIFFIILSLCLKWKSSNCKYSPF